MGCDSLPYAQTVTNVTLTRNSLLPVLAGFGIIMFLTDEAGIAGGNAPNVDNRSKIYYGVDGVLEDYEAGSEAYKAAATAFSQSPAPMNFMIGFSNAGETLLESVVAVKNDDCSFYGIAITATLRDKNVDQFVELAGYVAANTHILGVCTNDMDTMNADTENHIAHKLQASNLKHVFCYFSKNANDYPEIAMLANGLAHDFNNDNSYYTSKYKTLNGVETLNEGSAAVQAITGFAPPTGLDDSKGFFANCYVNVGGVDINIEGIMCNGEFFDQIHFGHWLVNAVRVNILTEKKKADYIPNTDSGIVQLGGAIQKALDQGVRAGGIGSKGLDDDGKPYPAYTISLPRRANIPDSLAAQRIVPSISVTASETGSIHYSIINIKVEV